MGEILFSDLFDAASLSPTTLDVSGLSSGFFGGVTARFEGLGGFAGKPGFFGTGGLGEGDRDLTTLGEWERLRTLWGELERDVSGEFPVEFDNFGGFLGKGGGLAQVRGFCVGICGLRPLSITEESDFSLTLLLFFDDIFELSESSFNVFFMALLSSDMRLGENLLGFIANILSSFGSAGQG